MRFFTTANRLKSALNACNMSARELSLLSGVKEASISQYINGTHKPGNVNSGKMANILGCDPVWLMGFDVSNSTSNPHLIELPSDEEMDMICKYRLLDQRGKDAVLETLNREYTFVENKNKKVIKLITYDTNSYVMLYEDGSVEYSDSHAKDIYEQTLAMQQQISENYKNGKLTAYSDPIPKDD